MHKLEDAIKLIKYYNEMSFDEFADWAEKYGGEISKETREEWKFIGLNNIAFLSWNGEVDKEDEYTEVPVNPEQFRGGTDNMVEGEVDKEIKL